MWQITCTKVRLSEPLSLSGISVLVYLVWMSGRLTAPKIHGSCALNMSTELMLKLNVPDSYLLETAVTWCPEPSACIHFTGEWSLPSLSPELCPGPSIESASSQIKTMRSKPCHKHLARWLKFWSWEFPLPSASSLLLVSIACCSLFHTLEGSRA